MTLPAGQVDAVTKAARRVAGARRHGRHDRGGELRSAVQRAGRRSIGRSLRDEASDSSGSDLRGALSSCRLRIVVARIKAPLRRRRAGEGTCDYASFISLVAPALQALIYSRQGYVETVLGDVERYRPVASRAFDAGTRGRRGSFQ